MMRMVLYSITDSHPGRKFMDRDRGRTHLNTEAEIRMKYIPGEKQQRCLANHLKLRGMHRNPFSQAQNLDLGF